MKNSLGKMPWEHPELNLPWKTQSAFYSWLRGVFRAGWSHYPLKMEYLKSVRKKIINPNPKGRQKEVFGHTCALCHKDFIAAEIELDHKHGNNTLRCREDIQEFVERLFLFDFNDVQAVCKTCHKAKSYGERAGISFEESVIEKKVIAICKLPASEQIEWIEKKISPRTLSKTNAKERRDIIRNILSKE